jgi:predicted MFS family arabinose efflux permease
VGLAFATAFAALSRGLGDLIFWRVVQGLFTPGVFAVTVAYIHDEWPVRDSGSATAAYVGGTVVGGFVGRATTGAVADALGWRAGFAALALLNLITAAALAAWLPRERRQAARSGRPALSALTVHLRNSQLQATFAIGLCVLFTLVAMFTYATFLLAAPPFDLGATALGSLFFVYLIGAIITPVAGRWIDQYGHRRALGTAVGVSMLGALLTLWPALVAIVSGLALCAAGVFVAQATANGYIGAAAQHDRGLAVGLYASFYYVGGSLGAAVPGLFWSHGGWPATVGLVLAVQALSVAMAFTFWRDRPAAALALPEAGP